MGDVNLDLLYECGSCMVTGRWHVVYSGVCLPEEAYALVRDEQNVGIAPIGQFQVIQLSSDVTIRSLSGCRLDIEISNCLCKFYYSNYVCILSIESWILCNHPFSPL